VECTLGWVDIGIGTNWSSVAKVWEIAKKSF
jgi:hypothetical protein